ncbi:putative tellurite resistance protein B-like protein [Inhella inkyongensis]|uniref:Putative tellurite resistance protein B-like protein n=1 Tax=Inhella inkyongensis TaxID=392593 RepID=A0A840S3Y8_9BURK|nr:TerB family tellurite resistance protein [Inhella inkyongensis]MBB5204168.1 putative tellurite resistance protein B-like protein [Inhella inkyongensis]
MRSYPMNSPQAAARIVALTLISDGVASPSEFEALGRMRAAERLGLSATELLQVLRELCEDLLTPQASQWQGAVDSHLLPALLDEVRDPALRAQVLALCVAVAEADAHLSDGEGRLLALTAHHWSGAVRAASATWP